MRPNRRVRGAQCGHSEAWQLPGLVIVAPAAGGTTWTLDREDVGFVDRALHASFRRCRVNPGGSLWVGFRPVPDSRCGSA
jgi:hypothetical protein